MRVVLGESIVDLTSQNFKTKRKEKKVERKVKPENFASFVPE